MQDKEDVDEQSEGNKKSFFTDEKGNLKFVNLVVRFPTLMIFVFLILGIGFSYAVQSSPANETGFTAPNAEYDLSDVRSIAYDSLRLAVDDVSEDRENARRRLSEVETQTESLDYLYWVYESETESGVFGTTDSITSIKETIDLIKVNDDFDQYCQKVPATGNSTDECFSFTTAIDMYYASSWNSDLVETLIDQFKSDAGLVDVLNNQTYCVLTGLNCDPDTDYSNTRSIFVSINNITQFWDGEADTLIDDFAQATTFAAYLLELNAFKYLLKYNI